MAQQPPKSKDPQKIADFYFSRNDFREAVVHFLAKQQQEPENFQVKYKIGVCYFEVDSLERASSYFKYALKNKDVPNETYLYLGHISRLQHKFETAAQYYKLYMGTLQQDNPIRQKTKALVQQCVNASRNYYKQAEYKVENLGKEVNTPADEYNPMKDNKAGNVLYFSRSKKYSLSDVIGSEFVLGNWKEIAPLQPYNEEAKEESFLGVSQISSRAYLFSGKDKNWGTIYVDSFIRTDSMAGIGSKTPFSPAWGSTFYIFRDSLVIFSAENEKSYGGEDLFYTRKLPWGGWSEPQNMGVSINTPYDEKHPFLANDGRTLYFSSNNTRSNGGFDVFKSFFVDSTKQWTTPELLPMPLNSTGDDVGFNLSEEGLYGYFSSNRHGGAGGMDLYKITFKKYLKEQVATTQPADFSIITEGISVGQIPQKTINEILNEPVLVKVLPEQTSPAKETVLLPYIYYNQAGGIDVNSYGAINLLSKLLKENPDIKVSLIAHTDSTQSSRCNALAGTVRRIKDLAATLISQGVKIEQLQLKAAGFVFPIAIRKDAQGRANPNSSTDNNRVEVHMVSTANLNILPLDTPVLPHLRDGRGDSFIKIMDGYYFAVQLISMKGDLYSSFVDSHTKSYGEILSDLQTTRYTIGPFTSLTAARMNLELAKSNGYPDAKIFAYHKNQRLDSESAKAHMAYFPELSTFLGK